MGSLTSDTMTPLLENVLYYIKGIRDSRENHLKEERLRTLGDKEHEFYMYGMKDEANSRMIATTSGVMSEEAYQKSLEVLSTSTAIYQATNMVEPVIIQTKMTFGDALLDVTQADSVLEVLEKNQLNTDEFVKIAKDFIELYLSTYNTKIQLAKLRLTNVTNGLKVVDDLTQYIKGIQESKEHPKKEIDIQKYAKRENMFVQGIIAERSSQYVATMNGSLDQEKYEQTLLLLTIDIAQGEANSDLCVLNYDERKVLELIKEETVGEEYAKKNKTHTDRFLRTIENTFINGYTDMYNMKIEKTK